MTYAHVVGGTIDAIGQYPDLEWDGTRWWDLRDPDIRTARGWLPVTETPRPADTATTTYDYSITLVNGVPTETWTARTKTQAEIDADAAATNEQTLLTDTSADLTKLRTAIDDLALLLADETTVGSIRYDIGTTADPAGTNTLRALKAQSNTNVTSASSIKGFINLAIDLAQRQIDDAQATRKVARQTLRLARQMVGDYSSADVGAP